MSNLETAKDLGKGIYTKAEVDLSIEEISVESVGSGIVSKSDVYSLDEVKTDKLYLGKPVYRKVIEGSFGESGVDSSNFLIHNDLELIVNAKAVTSQVAGYTSSVFGFQSTDTLAYYFIQSTSDNKSVYGVAFHSEWVNQPWTATIEYTKTTDSIQEPEALNIIQTEMPTYSTEEVLTTERWIDGKPIYRIVLERDVSEIKGNSWNVLIDYSDLNASIIVNGEWGVTDGIFLASESGGGEYAREATFNPTALYGVIGSGFSGMLRCNLSYTKTTDTTESPVAQLSISSESSLTTIFSATTNKLTTSGTLSFETIHVNVGSMTVSNTEVTITENGIYELHINGNIANIGQLQIIINGTNINYGYEGDDRAQISVTCIRELKQSDIVTFTFDEIASSGAMFDLAQLYIKKIG